MYLPEANPYAPFTHHHNSTGSGLGERLHTAARAGAAGSSRALEPDGARKVGAGAADVVVGECALPRRR
jgi:hypothetical protein